MALVVLAHGTVVGVGTGGPDVSRTFGIQGITDQIVANSEGKPVETVHVQFKDWLVGMLNAEGIGAGYQVYFTSVDQTSGQTFASVVDGSKNTDGFKIGFRSTVPGDNNASPGGYGLSFIVFG